MRKFYRGIMPIMAAAAFLAQFCGAQAADYNQWRLMPQKQAAAAESGADSKPHKKRAERVRLVNAKDRHHRLALACRANSGRVQISFLSGGGGNEGGKAAAADGRGAKAALPRGSAAAAAPEGRRSVRQKTSLSLLTDGAAALKDSPAFQKTTARGFIAVRSSVRGDAAAHFISQFLTAKKSIVVVAGGLAPETFSAVNAAQAGLALQNCLRK